jgi:hypothetical protein
MKRAKESRWVSTIRDIRPFRYGIQDGEIMFMPKQIPYHEIHFERTLDSTAFEKGEALAQAAPDKLV